MFGPREINRGRLRGRLAQSRSGRAGRRTSLPSPPPPRLCFPFLLRFLNYRRSSQRRQHHPHQVRILTICFVPHFSFCTILFIAFTSAFASAFDALFVFCFFFPCPCGVQNVTYRLLLHNYNSSSVGLVNLFSSALLSLYSMRRFLLLHSCLFCHVCLLWKLENALFFLINLNSPCVDVLDCEETHDSWLWISLCFSFNSLKNDKPLWLYCGEVLLFANLQEAHYCFHCNRLVPRMIELILLSQIFVSMITSRSPACRGFDLLCLRLFFS